MKVEFSHDDLRPLIAEVVQQTLEAVDTHSGRLAYPEKEAAELLGMAPHQLRDRRLEGQVQAAKVGRTWYYTRRQLNQLLEQGTR